MALMSEERRKEMEEEMNRFELEIAVPGESKLASAPLLNMAPTSKPLTPPPPPPVVTALIPEVLAKPPPPPPPLSPPIQTVLRPPPPPPPVLQPQPPSSAAIRFIPHQLQRQPPRPQVRPNFMGMRGPPMPGPPAPFPPPGAFGPPVGQGPPMAGPPMPQVGPMHPGAHMHPGGPMLPGPPIPPVGPMHPGGPMPPTGPMHPMPPGTMPMPSSMPPPMGNINMNVSLPMPPGFCPPGPPIDHNTNMRFESPTFTSNVTESSETVVSISSSSEGSTVLASAPTIYAAPFMKSHPENATDNIGSTNGQENITITTTASTPVIHKPDKMSYMKNSNDSSVGPTVPLSSTTEESVVTKKKEKKKKIVRMAGGQAWEDNSLLDWDSDDFRIFCGDLGNDVTDEVLIRAFSKYSSFVKAKVIRDKRTNKTKGFGFVSFKDPQDFIKAMREMNGRYVGSRPIKLRKSTWKDRNIDIVKKKQREKEKLGLL